MRRWDRAASILKNAIVREAKVSNSIGPRELPIAGRVVCAVAVSRFVPFLRLHFWGAGGPFRLTTPEREWSIDPQAGPDAAYLLLVSKKIDHAIASDDGGLVVDFTDADRLIVPRHEYEPWQLDGEDGSLFVSVAGGGLAVWDARPKKAE